MEILFIWIEKYNVLIENGFNFGGEYLFDFKNQILKCTINRSYLDNFYGDNIANITAVIGENGSGKTSLLEVITRNLTNNLSNIQTKGIFIIKHNKQILIYVHEKLEFNEEKSKGYLNEIFDKSNITFEIIRFEMTDNINGKSNITNIDLNTSFIYFSNIYGNGIFKRSFAYEDLTTVGLIEMNKTKSYEIAIALYKLHEIKNQIKFVKNFKDKKIISFSMPDEVKVSLLELDTYKSLFKELGYADQVVKKFKSKNNRINPYRYRFMIVFTALMEKKSGVLQGQINHTWNIGKLKEYADSLINKTGGSSIEVRDRHALVDYINNIQNKGCKEKDNSIVFDVIDNEQNFQLESLINLIINSNIEENIFEFLWADLSTGQNAFLNLFSRFYSIKNQNLRDNIIILIDEGEVYLHPKWQRRFLEYVIENIPKILFEVPLKNIQIILTSNTPFLVSDLPKQNIILLENGQSNHDFKQTFGANIHTLLTDSFFMDSTVGEFAKTKINKIIDELENIRMNIKKCIDKELEIIIDKETNDIDEKFYNMFKKKDELQGMNKYTLSNYDIELNKLVSKIDNEYSLFIEIVGEPIIRRVIRNMLDDINFMVKHFRQNQVMSRDDEIKYHEEMLEKLKREKEGDCL